MINCIITLTLLVGGQSVVADKKVTGVFLYEYMGYIEGDFSEGVKKFKLDGKPSEYRDIIIKKEKCQ